jgi:hypothetical protein
MRYIAAVFFGLVCATVLPVAEPDKPGAEKRYGVEVDLKTFPQGGPKDTLASVLKAIENKRVEYVVAQLADPAYIDEHVKGVFGGKFEEQVTYTQAKLDPAAVKLLERFLKDGDWAVKDSTATVRLKDVKDHAVSFVKIGERWYIKNEDKPE